MWISAALIGTTPTLPPDVLLPFGGTFRWADVDGDGVDDPLLVHYLRGVVQMWPSSRPAAEPELWSPPGACGYTTLAVERSRSPDEPILLAVSYLREDGFWVAQHALTPGAETPVLQWDAWVGTVTAEARYLGDVDGDGVSDVFAFTATDAGSVRLSSTGVWKPLPVPLHDWDLDPLHRVDDLDGDGFADLAVLTKVTQKPGGLWGSLVHSVLLLRGGVDGFAPEPLWQLAYRPQEDWQDSWESPGVGVVRLENAAGAVRLALSWTDHSGYESNVSFRSIDLLGDVGTSTPTVLQTVSPSEWYINSYWNFAMVRMDGPIGSSVVVATDGEVAWFGWDPAADQLSAAPDAGNIWASAYPFGADPGPFGAGIDTVKAGYGLWGWSPPSGVAPITLASDDPRLVDCLPLPPDPPPDTGEDPAPETGTDTATDTPEGTRSPDPACGCRGTPLIADLWLALPLMSLSRRRRPGTPDLVSHTAGARGGSWRREAVSGD